MSSLSNIPDDVLITEANQVEWEGYSLEDNHFDAELQTRFNHLNPIPEQEAIVTYDENGEPHLEMIEDEMMGYSDEGHTIWTSGRLTPFYDDNHDLDIESKIIKAIQEAVKR